MYRRETVTRYIGLIFFRREPLVYLDFWYMFVRHCQIKHRCPVLIERVVITTKPTVILETRLIHHVYPTWSAQPHGGLGHGPEANIHP